MKRVAILLGLAFLALGPVGVSSSADLFLAGNDDPFFASGEIVTHIGSSITGIAVQPDLKIVVAASSLARYLPNGSPDSSFGNGGYVETPTGDNASAQAIALQPDGKIVVAGSSQADDSGESEFTIARYNSDGFLDTSFGTDGISNTAIPEPASPSFADAKALAILPDGELLVGGTAGFENDAVTASTTFFALARYEPDGSLDPTFGDGGIVQTRFDGDLGLNGIAVLSDGGVLAVGTAYGPGHGVDFHRMALVRYEPDGALDPKFGNGGKVASPATPNYYGGPFAIQDRKIVVAGATHTGLPLFARYTERGRLDTTFGKHGFAKITRVAGWPTAVLAQKHRKIVFAAPTYLNSGLGISAVARLLPNGRLDASFGRGGVRSLPVGAASLALQTDQDILVGGYSGDEWTLERLVGGNNCIVPGLHGKTVSKARAALKKSYCQTGRVSKQFSSTVARGRVISIALARGDRLPGGSKIDLVVSRGRRAHRS